MAGSATGAAPAAEHRPRGLAPEAYETIPGDRFRPYVAPERTVPRGSAWGSR